MNPSPTTTSTYTCFNTNSNKLTFDEWVNKYISVTWRVGKFSNTDKIDRWGSSRGEMPLYFLYRIVDWVNEKLGYNNNEKKFIDDIFFFYDDNYSEWAEEFNEEVYSPIGIMRIYNMYLVSDDI